MKLENQAIAFIYSRPEDWANDAWLGLYRLLGWYVQCSLPIPGLHVPICSSPLPSLVHLETMQKRELPCKADDEEGDDEHLGFLADW